MKYSFNKKGALFFGKNLCLLSWPPRHVINSGNWRSCGNNKRLLSIRYTLVNSHSNGTFGPFEDVFPIGFWGFHGYVTLPEAGWEDDFLFLSVRHGRTRGGVGGMVGPEVWTLSMCVSDHIDTFNLLHVVFLSHKKSRMHFPRFSFLVTHETIQLLLKGT